MQAHCLYQSSPLKVQAQLTTCCAPGSARSMLEAVHARGHSAPTAVPCTPAAPSAALVSATCAAPMAGGLPKSVAQGNLQGCHKQSTPRPRTVLHTTDTQTSRLNWTTHAASRKATPILCALTSWHCIPLIALMPLHVARATYTVGIFLHTAGAWWQMGRVVVGA